MFMFNLRVSLSQREIEKDSERILDVFESKLKKGEVLTGQMPLGYVVRSKSRVSTNSMPRLFALSLIPIFSVEI